VAPQNLIATYQASSSPVQFHNAIIKLKPPVPKKAKEISKFVSEGRQIGQEISDGPQDAGIGIEIQNDHTTPPANQVSNALEAEVSELRATVTEKDRQIADLQDLLERKNQELNVLDDAVNSLRRFLGKIRLNLEMKTPHAMLFEMVSQEEWVYEKKFGYLKMANRGAELSE